MSVSVLSSSFRVTDTVERDRLGSDGSLRFCRFGSLAFIPALLPISFSAQGKLLLDTIEGLLLSLRLSDVILL